MGGEMGWLRAGGGLGWGATEHRRTDLVADAAAGRVKVDAVLLGKLLDALVLGQVLGNKKNPA